MIDKVLPLSSVVALGSIYVFGKFSVIPILLVVGYYCLIQRRAWLSVPEKPKEESIFKVEPVDSTFDWETEKPLSSYPFKDKEYKLTMGISTLAPKDWLLMEDTYLGRIREKQKIITNSHPSYPLEKDLRSSTVFLSPEGEPALREFYDVVVEFMTSKYPMYFERQGDQIYNNVTKESIPAPAGATTDPQVLLSSLVGTIEEDFIILMKDPTKHGQPYGDEYFFKAGVFAFAAGFDPKDKFNQPLTMIHAPIPGYESKLKLSMNRFFEKLEPRKFVLRSNFSVQTHDKFYVDDANKGYHLTDEELSVPIPYETLDFDKQVHYRSERQVLIKLPQTGAIVFTIRTYLHPMRQFEENKEAALRLKGALAKFPEDMAKYKNIIQPRPAVSKFIDEIL